MAKKEFTDIRNVMVSSAIKCPNRNEYFDEIAKLDFATDHANATSKAITASATPEIRFLAINLGHMRYVYKPEKDTVLSVDLNRTSKSGYITDPQQKEEIIHKITTSKTMTKKIIQATQQV